VLVIAIDVMSGDQGPRECVAGALHALRANAELHALLVGRPADVEPLLAAAPESLRAQFTLIPAQQVIAMDEAPRAAIRRGRDSSMRIAINLVKEGRAGACVSAGNTGALTGISHFVLKTVPGVERAAIVSSIPSSGGHTHMLDLGANTGATPQQLFQFAAMGAIIARDIYGVEAPRVGLLNIGEEEAKGHEGVQAAHALLSARPLGYRYLGFVEGNHIFSGEVDVVVTDGFTGNVALKTMEGLARLIVERTRREFHASTRDRLAGWVAAPTLRRLAAGLDARRYNGACMVGLGGVVVKSHGSADALAFAHAVELAALAVRRGLTAHISQAFQSQGG
jgi:glycerol-3-phosphate acyltransferase PlsX